MSDKSFGDCPNRNIVKNPLLSTAVTGLSIEDLTHNAVLIPVAANQGLVTRSDQQIGTNNQSLGHTDNQFINFPSGDSNTNVFPPQTTVTAYPHSLEHNQMHSLDRKPDITPSTVSKALPKSEDDFDVNEYFARLQGTRYVSAPINSNPDQNANLVSTEENLEEINLNEDPKPEIQQSLTADIAQNFSQLPTVLPHVASAVFSSFSNMLNYKSREQTPDERTGFQDTQYQSQTLGPSFSPGPIDMPLVENIVKEVAPPPKEPPLTGASNFRLSTKKKYAQIPGLSSGHTEPHSMPSFPPVQNTPPYFVPTIDNKPQDETPIPMQDAILKQKPQNNQEIYNIFNPIDKTNVPSEFQHSNVSVPKEDEPIFVEEKIPPPLSFGQTTIPPPPMFSTQRRDSQTGKTPLPPSVARRIGSNHPIIKPPIMQTVNPENIFVPTFDSNETLAQPMLSESSQSAQKFATNPPTFQQFQHDGSLPPASMPNIPPPAQFTLQPPPEFNNSITLSANASAPISNINPLPTLPSNNLPPTNISGPSIFPSNLPPSIPMFEPTSAPIGAKPEPLTQSREIFPPTIHAHSAITQPTIGLAQNTGPPLIGPPIGTGPQQYFSSDITKVQTAEPPKPVIEPPKSIGVQNFRMNKKRPQYYSGPIEGVGSISNNVKPVIPPLPTGTFQGAMFTPQQQSDQKPFDISSPLETVPSVPQYNVGKPVQVENSSTAFDITQPAPVQQPYSLNPAQNYDTAFDFSRSTTESYDFKEAQPESKGFGIIGSLKSKLSNIDINKIQHSVTTFFDPGYMDTKKDDGSSHENAPYSSFSHHTQKPQSDLEIFVPPVYQIQGLIFEQYNTQYNNLPNRDHSYAGPSTQYYQYQTNPDMYTQTYNDAPTQVDTHPPESISFYTQDNVVIEKGLDALKINDDITRQTIETKPVGNTTSNITMNPTVAPQIQNISVDNESAKTFFDMGTSTTSVKPEVTETELHDTEHKISTSANKIDTHFELESNIQPINLFHNLTTSETEIKDAFANKTYDDNERPNIFYSAQTKNVFDNLSSNKTVGDNDVREEKAENIEAMKDLKPDKIFPSTSIDSKNDHKKAILKDSILDSLNKDAVPILGVSSVPLFGLSAIATDETTDFKIDDPIRNLNLDQNSSLSFFDHPKKHEDIAPERMNFDKSTGYSFFENLTTPQNLVDGDNNDFIDDNIENTLRFVENVIGSNDNDDTPVIDDTNKENSAEVSDTSHDIEHVSELSICETCREVNIPDDKEFEDQDLTTHLIENITSPIQLLNPVEAVLPEENLAQPVITGETTLDDGYLGNDIIDEAMEETMHPKHSATDLLEDKVVDDIKPVGINYGWTDEEVLKPEYSFNIDPNSLGVFFQNKSIFFDKIPSNADDVKHNEDLLAKQILPSAPPAEEDSKSDEAGVLDVNSIEQDASKDFPIFEEFVIEPETEKEEPNETTNMDSFTNRVERYKNTSDFVEGPKKLFFDLPSHPISMASYFDTGNYAADNYYRNTQTISIPPGFEEEYKKRMLLMEREAKERENKSREDITTVPETTTQIKSDVVQSYSHASSDPSYSYSPAMSVGFNVEANITSIVEDQIESREPTPAKPIPPAPEEKKETKLPDPINFFTDNAPPEAPENFSRLASYFSTPPKTDHAKSFFELSESQNHYRHASEAKKYHDLMKDLTAPRNLIVTKDQNIRHVNYFTVEYDTVLPDFYNNKGDASNNLVDDTDTDLNKLVMNCRDCAKVFDSNFKVRCAMNDNKSENSSDNNNMDANRESGRGSVTVNFDESMDLQEDANEGVAAVNENRSTSEYAPVKHHWFYRVDVEDKSIWRGFSVVDSRALETAFLDPDLSDDTLVATDGGRYDVNIVGRLRIPVYWSDKPTNVMRCSWFYKGTTDARYVPYSEATAEKLEEEYRHGMTTGDWHRRLVLPNGEVVVMHGPSVMVHFLHSDAFSSPPQSSSRPRVVRRGHDESEIEDTEPSSIDHLLLLCHGVGSACDMRFRSVEEVVEDFRATSLQLIQSHYRNSYDQGVVSRVEVLPISWHSTLHSGETGVDRRLSQITLDSIPRLRSFTNDTVLDVLFYTSPVFCQTIINTVCMEMNRIYQLFVQRNPSFKGGVSLGGHSLGSVILYDLLCHQTDATDHESSNPEDKRYVSGLAGTGQPTVRYPSLVFAPDALYALGSPIAIFECIRGVESLGAGFSLPTCKNFFNIFHPYDPIAYRIEPLINPRLRELKPFLIPHHKGRKRMHLELKDTMARVGADLKQKLVESIRSTWNKWKAQPPTDGQLEKVVEEELEKEHLCEDNNEETAKEMELSTPEMLGQLNGGRRVDYVLQEAPLEMINEYLFAMSSHVGYWESEDTMLLMLREIYSALGVQPDSTVPQQNMTVQRTRISKQDDTTVIVNASDFPSTSHGI